MVVLKIILIIMAIFAGLVLTVIVVALIVGRFLRKNYQGKVEAIIDRPIEDVWAAVLDGENNPISAVSCKNVTVEIQDDGSRKWIEDIGTSQIHVTVNPRKTWRHW